MRTVLVVDDQPAFLQLARRLLAGAPTLSVVGEATSGEEALALLPRLRPEVVLLDIQLPGMNGFETARHMMAACPEVRLVIVSSYDDPQFEKLAQAVGAVGFLAKKELSAKAIVHLVPE